jgi:hypothetical protein
MVRVIYSEGLRERMIMHMDNKGKITWKDQDITRSKPVFYTLMSNLKRAGIVNIKKGVNGDMRKSTYSLSFFSAAYLNFLEKIREAEGR